MIGIKTEQVWVKEDADLSTCTGCNVMIVSAKYVLSVKVSMLNNSETIPTNTVLCESCYEAAKIKES